MLYEVITQARLFGGEQIVAALLELLESRHDPAAVIVEALPEVVEVERQAPIDDARMLAAQAVDDGGEAGVDASARQRDGQSPGGIVDPVDGTGRLGGGKGCYPGTHEMPAFGGLGAVEVALPVAMLLRAFEFFQQRIGKIVAGAGDHLV